MAQPFTLSPRSGVLNREPELSLANDYHGHVSRAICVMVGTSARNAFSYKNRQPSSQQLKQMRIDFSLITINLEVTWRLSDVQVGSSVGLFLRVIRLLLQLQPEQGGEARLQQHVFFSSGLLKHSQNPPRRFYLHLIDQKWVTWPP